MLGWRSCPTRSTKIGERRGGPSSLVCIGRELDHAAASRALDRCLLTKKEMAAGEAGWTALPDPLTSVRVQAAEQAAQAAAAAVAAAEAAMAQAKPGTSGQPAVSGESRRRSKRRVESEPRAAAGGKATKAKAVDLSR